MYRRSVVAALPALARRSPALRKAGARPRIRRALRATVAQYHNAVQGYKPRLTAGMGQR